MNVTVLWDPAALFVFYCLPPLVSARIDRSVIAFAERGEGHVEWAAPYYRLKAGKHDVVFTVDEPTLTMTVLQILRMRP
ncbi:MAG: hypothetical protein IPK82_40130 [Polyangiaceae bacterium]|nr:hypothetical protein [Polyangiaceae bacterium]